MLVTINANEFKNAVKKLSIVSTAKGTLSITGAIQCAYDGEGTFTMTTTNLYKQHTIKFIGVCTGNQPCKFTIDCNKVNKLLTCIKTTNVVMDYDEQSNKVVLNIGAKITFDSLTPADFYEFDVSAEPSTSLMFLQSSLKTALDKVFWASEKKTTIVKFCWVYVLTSMLKIRQLLWWQLMVNTLQPILLNLRMVRYLTTIAVRL